MRQLCTESLGSYSGRSVRHCDVRLDRIDNQSGIWSTKPGRMGGLSANTSETDSKRQVGIARRGEILDVIEQKSAEAIVAGYSRMHIQ